MELRSVLLFLFLSFLQLDISIQQRVAPGVPPQHYDAPPQQFQQQQFQQPPPPQYQQQQHQPQHQQQQFQQPPPQQYNQGQQHQGHQQQQGMHQQPPMQQQPQGHGHGHAPHGHHGGPPQQLLDASNVGQERAHIQEHLDVPIDTSQMSEQELQFHYFKMHDADNNNKLDGCELVKSLIHWHDQSNHDPKAGAPIPEAKIFQDNELIEMIDPILANDDKNKDGFIDYGEFVQAQKAASARQATQNSQAG